MADKDKVREMFDMYEGIGAGEDAHLSVDNVEEPDPEDLYTEKIDSPTGYRIWREVPEGTEKLRIVMKAKSRSRPYPTYLELIDFYGSHRRLFSTPNLPETEGIYDSGWLDAKELGTSRDGRTGKKVGPAIDLLWDSDYAGWGGCDYPMDGLVEWVKIYFRDGKGGLHGKK